MATFSTPGVYVQEIPKLPASVAQVATAIPAFIGYTAIDPGVPVRITSMLEFEQNFGGPQVTINLKKTVTSNVTSITIDSINSPSSNLYYSLQLYFANGGGPCYVVSTGVFGSGALSPTLGNFEDALDKINLEDEPTLLVSPDSVLLGSSYPSFINSCLMQCANLQDRFTIADVITATTPNSVTDATAFRTIGSNNLKYGAAYYPNLLTTLSYPDTAVAFKVGFTASGSGASALKALNGKTLSEALAIIADSSNPDALGTSNALMPILQNVRDVVAQQSIVLPPSGAIAGVYASVDATRGVWKAPANVSLNGVIAPVLKINDTEQGDLNIDATSGKSINVIRTFTGKGTLVWGARTLAGNDNEWKYVNVRRLFITAEESIKKATAFVVFEPNDANTWVRIKAMIENYLTGLWRDGALAGATPQEAFFVNVGLGTTMTSVDILEGRLNIEIGMAAVRPAEFIILNFSHKLQTS